MDTTKRISKYAKLEDFDSYEDYRKACSSARTLAYQKTEKGKLSLARRNKTEKRKISNRRYRKTDKFKLTLKKYRQGNGRKAMNSLTAKRRAAKLQRTPAWADLKAIKQFYLNCPKGYQVDHIVPLRGVNVSGFHVLNNLQYLTKSENSSKGNRYAL